MRFLSFRRFGGNFFDDGCDGIRRALQRVFQRAEGGLRRRRAVKLREADGAQFNLRRRRINFRGGSRLHPLGDEILLALRRVKKFARSFHLILCAFPAGHGALYLRNNLRLKLKKFRRRQPAPRLRLSDGALVLIQHRQLERQAERPFVIALIELIAGIQVQVGKLFRDFEVQIIFGGGVIRERRANVRAPEQRRRRK